MYSLWVFVIDATIVNIVPIALGFLLGLLLASKLKVGLWPKAAAVAASSCIAGIWSYSSFDIPDRSLELAEAAVLSIGMFGLPFLVAYLIFRLRNRRSGSI